MLIHDLIDTTPTHTPACLPFYLPLFCHRRSGTVPERYSPTIPATYYLPPTYRCRSRSATTDSTILPTTTVAMTVCSARYRRCVLYHHCYFYVWLPAYAPNVSAITVVRRFR